MPFLTQGKTNWKFLLIVIILAIIVGVVALRCSLKEEQIYQPLEIKKSETADWKIYRNDKYGYEIKYPETQDWKIEEGENWTDFGPSPHCISIWALMNPENLGVEEYFKKDFQGVPEGQCQLFGGFCRCFILGKNLSKTTLAGKEAFRCEIDYGPSVPRTDIFISINNYILYINKLYSSYAPCGEKNVDFVFDQMLSTFRFIEDKKFIDIDWIQEYFGKYRTHCNSIKDKYEYPNNYDSGDQDYPIEALKSEFYHFLSIPFHNSNKILRVYIPIKAEYFTDQLVRLIIYDKEKKTSDLIGDIKGSSGSNYGGIFVPYEIVKDDSGVILKACMGSPGAGGGSVYLGYKTLLFKDKELTWIAGLGAYFYDSFGKVIYITEGDNTPHYSKPGPSNNAVIYFRDLISGKKEIILNEEDTSYNITDLNEELGILNFEATKYYFSEECPRKESAQFCAEKIITERSIELP